MPLLFSTEAQYRQSHASMKLSEVESNIAQFNLITLSKLERAGKAKAEIKIEP